MIRFVKEELIFFSLSHFLLNHVHDVIRLSMT